jgi:hypothetical protein
VAGLLWSEDVTAQLKTELVDFRSMSTRILIDFPQTRLVYIENRKPGDSMLQPDRWSPGVSTALLTAGPVTLSGVLPQLNNPLSHAAGSAVFSESTRVSLDIDMDLGSRSGVVLRVIPHHLEWFLLYSDEVGAQFGSLFAIPVGSRAGFEFLSLLSDPADRLPDEEDESWFVDHPPFPGGMLSHLAGSLTFDLPSFSLYVSAAVSAGRLVRPGALCSLHMTWAGRYSEIIFLASYCTDHFFTTEGGSGDLQWVLAASLERQFRSTRIYCSYRKEIRRLPVVPAGYRESSDIFSLETEYSRSLASGLLLRLCADAEMESSWSSSGVPDYELRVDARAVLCWDLLELAAGTSTEWSSGNGWRTDLELSCAVETERGSFRLAMDIQPRPDLARRVAASFEIEGEDKRLYARVETDQTLSDYAFCIGWQAETTR